MTSSMFPILFDTESTCTTSVWANFAADEQVKLLRGRSQRLVSQFRCRA